MSINLTVPDDNDTPQLKPKLTVIGVGGAGGNAVNNMIRAELEGVDFVVANTDAQALAQSRAERRIQLGVNITQGLGAGSRPEVGQAAAEEAIEEILMELDGSHMAFIAAGMGGGTGTGGAPVIARAAKEHGILTVGVVTKPFQFEGAHRMSQAEAGLEELEQFVDTLIVIPNQNLFRIANEKTTFADAFARADEVLYSGVRGVTDLMVMPGLINLDFADIRSVMSEMGKAMMGTGEAEGERRALDAAEAAIANPLLDDTSMKGAKGVLINITGGMDITLFEVDEAANRIRAEVDQDAYIIVGSAFDSDLEGIMRVSVVATGIDAAASETALPTMLHLAEQLDHGEQARHRPEPALEFAPEPEIAPDPEPEPEPEIEPWIAAEATDTAEVDAEAEAGDEPAMATVTPLPQPELQPEPEPGLEQPAAAAELPVESPVDSALESPFESAAREAEIEPETEIQAEDETPPAAMPAIGATDAFIPPAPAATDAADSEPEATDAAADGDDSDADDQPEAPDQPTRGPSLFERVTGTGRVAFGRKAPAESAEVTEKKELSATDAAVATTAEAPEAGDDAGHDETGDADDAEPRLGGLDPEDRIAGSDAEEDLLDIPAFLRRQAH